MGYNLLFNFFKRFPTDNDADVYLRDLNKNLNFKDFNTFGMTRHKFLFLVYVLTEIKSGVELEYLSNILGENKNTIKKACKYIKDIWEFHKINYDYKLTISDLKALEIFVEQYPTWWFQVGVCSLTRDFDCAPQGHSPEIKYVETGAWGDDCFSCEHNGSLADAIENVLQQINDAKK